MAKMSALYRCVCGTDVPLVRGKIPVCSSCGRRHEHVDHDDPVSSQTLVLQSVTTAVMSKTEKSRGRTLVGQTMDHFEVLEELGSGGMGTVYRALDHSLERYVALKVLNSEHALAQKALVQAFVHEARAQARIAHPGIATIYHIGTHEDMRYVAMELIPGSTMEDRLREGPMPFGEIVNIGLHVVRALRAANASGVVHRDVKPSNMMLTPAGRVVVTDFGLSKTERGGLRITGSHSITGTPYYIAPEQARGETTDFRADIYSLGATLYHMAYRVPPFEGENFMAVISKHLSEPLRFPTEVSRDVPESFRFLLERMMAKDPRARFKSYDALEHALLDLRPEVQQVAAFARRGVAAALDYTAILLPTGVLAILLGPLLDVAVRAMKFPLGLLCASLLGTVISQQAVTGATPGKGFARMRIARIDGRRLGRGRRVARGLLQFLPLVLLSMFLLAPTWRSGGWISGVVCSFVLVDHFWALTNNNRRTLHDFLLKTWVVDKV